MAATGTNARPIVVAVARASRHIDARAHRRPVNMIAPSAPARVARARAAPRGRGTTTTTTTRRIIQTRGAAREDARWATARCVPAPGARAMVNVGGRHARAAGGGRTDRRRNAATRTTSASKGEGDNAASTEEIEKCLEDEECKSETLMTLENALASVDSDVVGDADGGVVVKKETTPKAFVNAKTIDESDFEDVVVSEPPLNIERLKSVGTIARSFEIWSFVVAFVFRRVFIGVKWSYKGGYTEEKRIARLERLASWLRKGLLRLGPTFIKVGQQFSTRVDVLSPQFIRELEKLQDRVPPFPTKLAKEILDEELGGPVESFFDNFEDTPLAAASLGQVHRAQMKATGEQVIIKVQRPGLKEIFDIDLKNLRVIAKWLQKVDPKNDGAKRDWVAIFDETARVLYDEVDYTNEAKNAEEFKKQFTGADWIKVPRIYWEFTKRRTLCMEYAPATKINDVEAIKAMGIDPDRMARLAVEAYLQQVLRFGFFHADPHPGNVAVDKGDPEGKGRLVVYDYGMMGRIPSQTRDGLLDLFYATYEGQSDSAVKALMKMGVLVDTGADLTAVKRTADFFLTQFDARINAQKKARETNKEEFEAEFKAPRTKEEKQQVRKRILSNIGEDLLVVSKDQPFRFPAEFTFVVVSTRSLARSSTVALCRSFAMMRQRYLDTLSR